MVGGEEQGGGAGAGVVGRRRVSRGQLVLSVRWTEAARPRGGPGRSYENVEELSWAAGPDEEAEEEAALRDEYEGRLAELRLERREKERALRRSAAAEEREAATRRHALDRFARRQQELRDRLRALRGGGGSSWAERSLRNARRQRDAARRRLRAAQADDQRLRASLRQQEQLLRLQLRRFAHPQPPQPPQTP